VGPWKRRLDFGGTDAGKVCQISEDGQNGAEALSGNSSEWQRVQPRQHFPKSVMLSPHFESSFSEKQTKIPLPPVFMSNFMAGHCRG
jgi:hypothetical protein